VRLQRLGLHYIDSCTPFTPGLSRVLTVTFPSSLQQPVPPEQLCRTAVQPGGAGAAAGRDRICGPVCRLRCPWRWLWLRAAAAAHGAACVCGPGAQRRIWKGGPPAAAHLFAAAVVAAADALCRGQRARLCRTAAFAPARRGLGAAAQGDAQTAWHGAGNVMPPVLGWPGGGNSHVRPALAPRLPARLGASRGRGRILGRLHYAIRPDGAHVDGTASGAVVTIGPDVCHPGAHVLLLLLHINVSCRSRIAGSGDGPENTSVPRALQCKCLTLARHLQGGREQTEITMFRGALLLLQEQVQAWAEAPERPPSAAADPQLLTWIASAVESGPGSMQPGYDA